MHVSFAHGRNSDLRAFERFFGCPVEFGASRDQLAFSHETLAPRRLWNRARATTG